MSGSNIEPVIVIHGGAWAVPDSLAEASRSGVKEAARTGYSVLRAGGSAIEAVTASVRVLEDDPVFDAGRGSVLTSTRTSSARNLLTLGRNRVKTNTTWGEMAGH